VSRSKVLWVSHFVPYPPKGGAFQRSYNLMRGVGSAHDVHLLALKHKSGSHPGEYNAMAAAELGKFCTGVDIIDGTSATRAAGLATRGLKMLGGVPLTVSVSDVPQMRVRLRELLARERFDLVHFDTIGLGCYLDEIGDLPAVMCHHGAEAFMMLRRVQRERSLLRKAVFWAEGHLLRRYEARVCSRVARNLACSALDAKLMAEFAPGARFTVVANGVDVDYFHAMPPVDSRNVIFAGRLDQYSNRDAIRHFVHEVWPRVRARFSDAVLDILGANPPEDLVALSRTDDSIRIHGFVPDVRPYFEKAALAVCPIRDGGGTRVKILDNLSMGKPIVSTSIGVEGIDVVPERDLLIADSPSAFETQIARILEDAPLRARLAANARSLAERTYSWEGIVRVQLDAYAQALANNPGAR
jgi:glycosyltransferase involved in cell wall biosynthesis